MSSPLAPRPRASAPAAGRLPVPPWFGDIAALGATGMAIALRQALDDVLPPGFPFLTFFPAVILTTFFFGLRPGILCAALSGLAAWYFFIGQADTFLLDAPTGMALGFYAFIVTVDIALIHLMRVAGERLSAERAVSAELYEQQRTMFQELQHRVANNMQFVAALLALQKRKVAENPQAAIGVFDEAQTRLETIARIHRRLYDPARADQPIGQYLQELCSDLLDATGARNIVCLVDVPPVRLDLPRLTTLSLLVVEVVTNALKHAFRESERGTITIRLEALAAGQAALSIADDGPGIPTSFDPARSRSLGFRIVQGLATQLDGTLTYANDGGTVVRLVFATSSTPAPMPAAA